MSKQILNISKNFEIPILFGIKVERAFLLDERVCILSINGNRYLILIAHNEQIEQVGSFDIKILANKN